MFGSGYVGIATQTQERAVCPIPCPVDESWRKGCYVSGIKVCFEIFFSFLFPD